MGEQRELLATGGDVVGPHPHRVDRRRRRHPGQPEVDQAEQAAADGRDVYVLAADVAVADLNDAPPDVAVPPGSKAVIDSQHLTVTIDKATWLLATERIDLSFHIGSTAGNETLATTFSDLNQPVHFPSDMPASCSNTTT